jgi:type I restriction enzyme S subunit
MYPIRAQIEPSFLHRWLISPMFTAWASESQGRTVLPKINQQALATKPVPVPPLNEQKRIVTKIEALQARSNAAREALDAIPPLLEKFRQSVLAAAFRGDLTKAWRQANPDVEPATELLARIRAERRRRWEEANPRKKYVEPEPVDADGLPELPEGWCWASVDELVQSSRTGLVRSATEQHSVEIRGALPYVRMQHFDLQGRFDFTDLTYVELSPQERSDYELRPGDILFNTRNSYELVGKVAVWALDSPPHVFNNNIRALRVVDGLLPDWIGLQMQSPGFRARIRGSKSATTSICAIYTADMLRQPLALPSLQEQLMACNLLQQAEFGARLADENVRATTGRLERLNQSILAKAFRGELVPQDPTDEPASVLLERIRGERAAGEGGAGGGKGVRRGRKGKGVGSW